MRRHSAEALPQAAKVLKGKEGRADMSWDIDLLDEQGAVIELPESHEEGGTCALGGTNSASLNVTYNYQEAYRLCPGFDGKDVFFPRDLKGRKAKDTVEVLQAVVDRLGTKQYKADYWAPTPGNAGYAMETLLSWARQFPEAVWDVC